MTPEERFSEAFLNHVLTIEKEDGLYRSLLFKKPGCSMFWCRVVTWPNGLALTGDCGSFMVGHPAVPDILQWFPTDRDYLAGKITGHGAHNSLYEYSVEMALEAVEAFRGYILDAYPGPDEDEDDEPEEMLPKHVQKLADLDELKADLRRGGVPEYELRERLLEIDSDSWEWSFRDLSWQFRFQCLAVDAIKETYFKNSAEEAEATLKANRRRGFDSQGQPMDESRYWWIATDLTEPAQEYHKVLVRQLRKYGVADWGWNYIPRSDSPTVHGEDMTITLNGPENVLEWFVSSGFGISARGTVSAIEHCGILQRQLDHLKEIGTRKVMPRRDEHLHGMKHPGPRLPV